MSALALFATAALAVAQGAPSGTLATLSQADLQSGALQMGALHGPTYNESTASPEDTTRTATVRGLVLSAETGDPLANAVVSLDDGGLSIEAMTDSLGRYLLANVPSGPHRVRASHLGHDPLTVVIAVPQNGRMIVDFSLTVRPLEVAGVTAESETGAWASISSSAGDSATLGSDVSAAVRVLDATPGVAELGLTTAQASPDPDAPGSGDILYVRGGTAYLDYALLDGAPVQVPYHLGGLVAPLIPGAIAYVQQFRGGAPARYDGGISGLTAIDTRPAAKGHVGATGHLDMMSTGGLVEAGTEGGLGFMLAGRTIHGAWTDAFVDAFRQDYSDVLARFDVPLGETAGLSATGFHNRERLDLGFVANRRDEASWGNTAGSLRFTGSTPLGDALVVAALGRFSSRLPIGGSPAILATGSIERARLTADLTTFVGDVRLNYGLAGEQIRYETRFDDYTYRARPEAIDGLDGAVKVGEIRLPTLRRATGRTAAAYAETDWRVSSSVSLLTGMRVNYFTNGNATHLSPRAAFGWRATEDVGITLSVGRFSQYITVPDSQSALTRAVLTGTDGSALASSFTQLSVASSTHVLLGLGHNLGGQFAYRLEGNWKRLTGVPGATEAVESAGIQFMLSRSGQGFGMWGSYEMGWDWTDARSRSENFFAGRHLVRGGVATAFARRFTFDADIAFGSGLSYGAIPRTPLDPDGFGSEGAGTETPAATGSPASPIGQSFVQAPVPTEQLQGSYLRLNLKVGALWDFRVSGRSVNFRPYIRLVNALDRRDGLFYHFDPLLNGQLRAVGTVPAMPVIGFDFTF